MTAMFDFASGPLPVGATLTRAAGPWSHTAYSPDTVLDFTSGVLPAGVSIQRAAGPWSRRGESGALVKGMAADVARFDYEPPIENQIQYSAKSQFLYSDQNNMVATEQGGGVTKYVVGSTGVGNYNVEYFQNFNDSMPRTYSVDLRGEVGGEVLYIIGQNSGPVPYKRIVLTTEWQRYDISPGFGGQYWGFGTHNAGVVPDGQAAPAQTYYARRRQLNRGPVALAYVETTGSGVYVPPVCRGVMFEPERTNYVNDSSNGFVNPINTGGGVPASLTRNTDAAPDGTITADLLILDRGTAPNGYAVTQPGYPVPQGQSIALSCYVRSRAQSPLKTMHYSYDSDIVGQNVVVSETFKRLSLVKTAGGSFLTYSLGQYAGTVVSPFVTDTDQTASLVAWGLQFEVGATASSYIPTAATPATRPGEIMVIDAPHIVPSVTPTVTGVDLFFADGTSDLNGFSVVSHGKVYVYASNYGPKIIASARVRGLASGVMEFGTAADTPRFEHDPVTGARLGLLVEPERTNVLTRSREFGSFPWDTGNAITIDADAATAPDNTKTADRLSFPMGQGLARLDRTVDATIVPATLSIYQRWTGVARLIRLLQHGANFYPVAAAWGRISVTYNLTPASGNVSVMNDPNGGVGSAFIWGAQLEAGPRPTSYIPTTDAPATRPAETLTLDWGSKGVESGPQTIRYTFDDGSTQDLVQAVTAGKAVVPTSLNRMVIRSAMYIPPIVTPAGRTAAVLYDTAPRVAART